MKYPEAIQMIMSGEKGPGDVGLHEIPRAELAVGRLVLACPVIVVPSDMRNTLPAAAHPVLDHVAQVQRACHPPVYGEISVVPDDAHLQKPEPSGYVFIRPAEGYIDPHHAVNRPTRVLSLEDSAIPLGKNGPWQRLSILLKATFYQPPQV